MFLVCLLNIRLAQRKDFIISLKLADSQWLTGKGVDFSEDIIYDCCCILTKKA